MELEAKSLIDLIKYPIHKSNSEREKLINSVRKDLDLLGCAVIKSFLTEKAIKALTLEADGVSDKAYRSYNRTNAYFTKDDPNLSKNDPRRKFFDRSNAFIAADNFNNNGPLRTIHNFPFFEEFIKECLNLKNIYRYSDPLADVIINLANKGNGFPWHFDTNNFTVTIAIQNAEEGGVFEYAPNIRKKNENFKEVNKVLDGTSNKVVSINLEPGDLQLFKGRYSLHRVTPISGETNRYVAIISYVQEPNMVGSPERTKQLYGKVLPIHLERAGLRSDQFLD